MLFKDNLNPKISDENVKFKNGKRVATQANLGMNGPNPVIPSTIQHISRKRQQLSSS
jgi:hypothetical protein